MYKYSQNDRTQQKTPSARTCIFTGRCQTVKTTMRRAYMAEWVKQWFRWSTGQDNVITLTTYTCHATEQ